MARQILGKVVPTGEDTYDNNRTYDELCIVMYNGQSYISKKETRGNKPDNTEYWQQLVEKPVKGTDYFTEADKDEIVNDVTNDATNKYNQAVKTGIETFNQNAERKTSDFNNNASEKTDTYNANADNTKQAFTNNANSKTEAYNTNATEKLDTYNSNHTAKLKEYNDNATSKLSAYNTNTVTKTTEYNSNHTDKLNAYNTNASNKVDVYNTNADTRLEEYNTNANNKIAEYDEHSKELNNKIVSTRNELERLKSNVLNTGEDTDTFIHLEDSAMAELQEIKVYGVCKQVTTTGKNKFNVSRLPITLYGVTLSFDKDGNVVLNGTPTITSNYINFIVSRDVEFEPGTYTMSVENKKDGIGTVITGFEDKLNLTLSETGNSKTYTSTEKYTSTFQINVRYDVGTLNNFILNPQLEAGKTKTTYEMFTGGQPSPSPDYPQEIKTITDNLKVTSCNKNIFKITSPLKHYIIAGVDISINDNVITLNGTSTGEIWPDFIWGIQNNTVTHNKCKYYFSEQPEDCTASINILSGTATGGSFVIIANDDGSSTFSINFNNLQGSITHKANGVNRAYLSGITSGTKFNNFTFEIMLEKGSVVTAFERHIESQVQANLPKNEFIGKLDDTYKDTLRTKYFPKEGQYHLMLDKKVGKYTFTGNEEWFMSYGTGMFHANNIFRTASELTRLGKCTNYIYHIANSGIFNSLLNNQFAIQHYNTSTNIFIKDLRYSSIDDFKNMLKTNNIEIYYILQTPYTLDLGVIDMPMSYKDTTNIFTDSDLLPTINAKYYRVFDKTIQNVQINEKTLKQEITDLNATVSALDTRLKVLETKTVEEPTESEGTV